MSKAIDVSDSSFEGEVLKSDKPVIVDFWAPWCGPCRKISPIIDAIADEYKEKVKVVKVNVDENVKIAQEYSISGIPSILVFNEGEAKERLVGLLQKSAIKTALEKFI